MRFGLGFAVGCAVGALVATKASQLHRLDAPHARTHRDVEVTAEKVRAIGDLARERFTTILDSPSGEAARERVTELIGASLAGVGAGGSGRLLDPAVHWSR
jgi:hypothetical protein